MKISEIKAELDMRKVSYNDCFDRDSLEHRLNDARSSGKADPSIIDQFNKRNLEANVKGESFEVSDTVLESSVANDGNLWVLALCNCICTNCMFVSTQTCYLNFFTMPIIQTRWNATRNAQGYDEWWRIGNHAIITKDARDCEYSYNIMNNCILVLYLIFAS